MFRDFKFKVWDLVGKTMRVYEDHLVYKKYRLFDPEKEVSQYNPPYFFFKPDNNIVGYPSVIMEYTGLNDINGVEIYEGDIVKRTFKMFDFDTNDYIEKTEVSFVEYMGKGFWVKGESFGWEGEEMWDWNKIEVIGNVYETPELITLINDTL
jgi:uncharacterized phage protein (TIGR01671 family)